MPPRLPIARALAAAALTALFSGHGPASAQSPTDPNVAVANGSITVDQDPIRLRRAQVSNGRWQVTWALASAGGYRFADDGIKVMPAIQDGRLPDDLRCNRLASGLRFACSFKPRTGTFNYKYDISVVDSAGGRITLDPVINTNF
jgi:hypothetical protein